jgi:vitamin B12 transporter
VPYGEVNYSESVTGATLLYQQPITRQLEIEAVANYGYRVIDFVDKSDWVYDWFGKKVRMRRMPGEIDADATDQTNWQHGLYGRVLLRYRPHPQHSLRLSISPTYANRTGMERIKSNPNERDPLSAKRALATLISGFEWELNALPLASAPADLTERQVDRDYALQNTVLVKDYIYTSDTEEVIPGNVLRARNTNSHTFGVGDSVRLRVNEWLLVKASYELTTRFPRPDETFGDGRLIKANLELKPEISHNANLGPRLEIKKTSAGDFVLDTSGFLRQSDQLIVLLGNERSFSYQNVYAARALGVQGEVEWTAPGRYLNLQGSATYEDTRNDSGQGTFGAFDGDRIPSRPWLFGSWQAKLRFAKLFRPSDQLEPFYLGRYVHEYYRGWESQGLREFKQVVDAQTIHGAGITYSFRTDAVNASVTLEVHNLTDAKAYDFYGVQKPGRAFYAKVTGEFQ